ARIELAVDRFDTGVDVGAVDCVQAGIDEGRDVAHRTFAVDLAVAAGELPAAAHDARDAVSGRELDRLDHGRSGNCTAVVSAWLKLRLPSRVMRKRVGQC